MSHQLPITPEEQGRALNELLALLRATNVVVEAAKSNQELSASRAGDAVSNAREAKFAAAEASGLAARTHEQVLAARSELAQLNGRAETLEERQRLREELEDQRYRKIDERLTAIETGLQNLNSLLTRRHAQVAAATSNAAAPARKPRARSAAATTKR